MWLLRIRNLTESTRTFVTEVLSVNRRRLLDVPIVAFSSKSAGHAAVDTRERMIVTRRDPVSGTYRALGYLTNVADGYEFVYLESALDDPAFVPIIGFSDKRRRYFRHQLFPVFRGEGYRREAAG